MLHRSCYLTAVIGAAIGFSVAAYADDAGEGRALAEKVCSPCHVISDKAGPPFSEIPKGDYASPEALKNFLGSTHANIRRPNAMPNPELTYRQIEQIAAYLASLQAK